METRKKRLSHNAYTVALLAPLEVELSAVRYMLDEEHEQLPATKGDPNRYVLGQLSQHNVAIASLPAGYQGTISAAIVARDLAAPSSGVPSSIVDVRLGDVVVSVPSGTQGGVVQYDLGKQTTTGFQRKGFLCPPPNEWLATVPQIRSDHLRYPALSKYKRPSSDLDVLFKSEYDHQFNKPTCQSCDRQNEVLRPERSDPKQPVIHYGVIASGDRVMKNARERDMISGSVEGAICFEMEAAGLMNDFRCIVIRGISDYADSHKNDVWHPYAAAAAAAVAKELLSYLEASKMVKRSQHVSKRQNFFSLQSRLRVQEDDQEEVITLPALFEPWSRPERPFETPPKPKRILTEGRAGQPDGKAQAHALWLTVNEPCVCERVLFIPDGLDEVSRWERDIWGDRPQTMTSLYQSIVSKIWRKDILQLGIRDDQGHRLTEGAVEDIHQLDIENYVAKEINLIEGLAFHGLANDTIEFQEEDRASICRLLKRHEEELPRMSERVLRKVSFLRTSEDNAHNSRHSFHFLHLTFQEYFAARYFVRHWIRDKPLPCYCLTRKDPPTIPPRLFLQTEKYNAHYNNSGASLWPKASNGELVRGIFQQFEAEPRDLVGAAHQSLIMHCLSELAVGSSDSAIPAIISQFEDNLLQWELLKCKSHLVPPLISDPECPARVIVALFSPEYEQYHELVLETLQSGKRELPVEALRSTVRLLEQSNRVQVRPLATEVLTQSQGPIPQDIEYILVRILRNNRVEMRKAVAEGLLRGRYLSESTVHDIALLLEHCESDLRHTLMRATAPVKHLPERIVEALLQFINDEQFIGESNAISCLSAFLEDERTLIRYRAARALEVKNTVLPCWVYQGLVNLLADNADYVRRAAYDSLCCQQSLPEQILHTSIPLLSVEAKSENRLGNENAHNISTIFGNQTVLPDGVRQSVGRLLKARSFYTRLVAGWALAPQIGLVDAMMGDIALLLEQDNLPLRKITINKLLGPKHFRDRLLRFLRVKLKSPDVDPLPIASLLLVRHSVLPDQVLQGLHALLMGADSRMRDYASWALLRQRHLSWEMLRLLLYTLVNHEENHPTAATKVLAKQECVPNDIIAALVLLLKHVRPVLRIQAAFVLVQQPRLEENILHDLALLVCASESRVSYEDDPYTAAANKGRTIRSAQQNGPSTCHSPRKPSQPARLESPA
ncbi:uncharacterized protein BO95DRAFT_489014 [Aspergillus brunneoviolaceus CBS 621.78]|uniref:Uncharacterized protein n=1 Tax=Aspergillus brunneoviolaceus CBS 621.78 TaxID=1450534 RepID=A0ACD1FSA3_9EURO|nr:hypothetical protein BO95DRAFT_489014 [Aspergillus brunneoviolaceus CBS 621.78]RAH39858.1 hypothetical protein BO95DRAFT_489014 [Aspergillus brunneoviolaceus CBS 621.78]